MVFGSYKNGGLSGLKTAVRDEGALSERMRLAHIKELKDKQDQERAKTSLVEKKRLLDRNKIEISHRQTELRRLNSELVRSEALVHETEREMKEQDEKIASLYTKHNDMLFEISKHKEDVERSRLQIDKENKELYHYEQEIKALELKITREKELVRTTDQAIEHLSVKIAHLTNDATKLQSESGHEKSNKMYKEKELDARKRSYTILSTKKMTEENEVKRLTAENARLEQEIKKLEQEASAHSSFSSHY